MRLLVILVGLLPLLSFAASPKVEITAKGVALEAGSAGRFTIAPPVLVGKGKAELKPAFAADGQGGGRATYANGFVVDFKAGGDGVVVCSYPKPPEDALQLRFTTLLPINLNQGGRFKLGSGPARDFPEKHVAQILGDGTFRPAGDHRAAGRGDRRPRARGVSADPGQPCLEVERLRLDLLS